MWCNHVIMLDFYKNSSQYYIAPERMLMMAAIVSPAFADLPVIATAPTQIVSEYEQKVVICNITKPSTFMNASFLLTLVLLVHAFHEVFHRRVFSDK